MSTHQALQVKLGASSHTEIVLQTLTWSDHVAVIKQKLSKNVGILTCLRCNMTRNILLSLYHPMIEPYLTYCINV